MNITYSHTITANEVNTIRKAIGWRQFNIEQLQAELDGSAFIVAAYDGNNAIGMARLLWAGGVDAHIYNILMPQYQNQGVENELITRIFSFLRSKLKPGFGIQVDIKAWGNQEALYKQIGFQVSTTEQRGVPMHICLTNEIELTDKFFKQIDFKEK